MQHTQLQKPGGNRPIAIEVDGEPLGVVVRQDEGYRFLSFGDAMLLERRSSR